MMHPYRQSGHLKTKFSAKPREFDVLVPWERIKSDGQTPRSVKVEAWRVLLPGFLALIPRPLGHS